MSSTDKSEQRNDLLRNAPLVSGPQRANQSARPWQIVVTAIGAVAIITIVLFGLNQRDESKEGGAQTAATQITLSPPQGDGNAAQPGQVNQQGNQQQPAPPRANTPSTTGQGGGDQDAGRPASGSAQ